MFKKNGMSIFLIVNYLLIRFLYGNEVDTLLPFGTYLFEILFIGFTFFYFKNQLSLPQKLSKLDWFYVGISFILGLGICELAQSQSLVIPFDLSTVFAVAMLLFLGPILEELIFRQALWYIFQDLYKSKILTVLITALLFGYAHFHSYFMGFDSEIKKFIIFQTGYTFLMGLWWGLRYLKTQNPLNPIVLHIAFNCGFYIGTFI